MARKVEWTEPAWDDLAEVANYIARDSEYYAAAFVQEVKDAAASLSEFAERGLTVPEFGDPSIRELLIKSLWTQAPCRCRLRGYPRYPLPW